MHWQHVVRLIPQAYPKQSHVAHIYNKTQTYLKTNIRTTCKESEMFCSIEEDVHVELEDVVHEMITKM